MVHAIVNQKEGNIMRKTKMEKRPTVVLESVICDECGKECKNTSVEMLFKFSFCEDLRHHKDLCYACWEKKYKGQEVDAFKAKD